MPGSFFDTNILIYLASDDAAKADRAEAIVRDGGAISVQVLNEIANVGRRKMGMSWTDTNAFLTRIRDLLSVRGLTVEIHDTAMALAERHDFSVYDSMIAASALHADCETLWSEDMQDGMVVDDRLQIANPFKNS